jgi:hypothetical protein
MRRMYKKEFEKDSRGVSGAITAMMIILIISTFISLIYSVYIPNWTKDYEADHSKEVLAQFLDFKEQIDQEIINKDVNQGISVTNRFTLGVEGGPVFSIGRTSGALVVNPYQDTITVVNSDSTDEVFVHGRGNVTYTSQYQYYVNQLYTYQYGAVIVAQVTSTTGGHYQYDAVMRVEPHFNAVKDILGNVTITVIQVAFFGSEKSVSGTHDVVVSTTLTGVDSNAITRDEYPTLANLTLTLATDYPDVWYKYFKEHLDYNVSGMAERVSGAGDYNITQVGRVVTVNLWNVNALNVDIAIIEVDVK